MSHAKLASQEKIASLLVPVGKWKEMGGFYEVSSGTNSGGS